MKRAIVSLFACCLALFAARPASAADLHLFCAASLREAVNEIAANYLKTHPEVKFVKNFGASGTLARQIVNDAPADIFISANVEWLDYLEDRKLVQPTCSGTFAYNTLVFAGSTTRRIARMQDLALLQSIAIGSPKSVPAGEYAMDAIRKAGLETELAPRLVFAKDVRESLIYAERGEVDGAFVYRTDALLARKAKILFVVPRGLYPRVSYPAALTVRGAKSGEARAFYRYLFSSEARTILARYGFALN